MFTNLCGIIKPTGGLKVTKSEEIFKYARVIYNKCTAETCYEKVRNQWTLDNKFWGHCAVVSLLIQDKFGGQIKKCKLKEENISHYFNFIDGKDYDCTIGQYKNSVTKCDVKLVDRAELLKCDSTKKRYEKLRDLFLNCK